MTDCAPDRGFRAPRYQDGFSLLEMVVAVSILLILAVIGLIAYQGFTDDARRAALETAASEVYTAARAYALEPRSDSDPKSAEYDYNNSQIGNDNKIIAKVELLPADRLRVTTRFEEGTMMAIRETPGRNNTGDEWGSDGGQLTPPEGAYNTNMTYQCDSTRSGYLGIVNVAPDTVVTMWEADDPANTIHTVDYIPPSSTFDLRPSIRQEILRSQVYAETGSHHAADEAVNEADRASGNPGYTINDTVQNTSSVVTMEGGVTYHVSYEGAVETFASPGHQAYGNADHSLADCLVSVDHFGESTELVNVVYIGGAKLHSVPDNLPPTVRSLRGAFENTVDFNDPSIRTWDTSNVSIMQSMFYNAKGFNQDLNTWSDGDHTYWDTENVLKTNMMFSHATEFNNGSAPGASDNPLHWNMANTYSISSMFSYTNSFNQPLATWETSDVQLMRFLFLHAKAFDQDISSWELPQLEDALRWDDGASKLPAEHKPAVLRG